MATEKKDNKRKAASTVAAAVSDPPAKKSKTAVKSGEYPKQPTKSILKKKAAAPAESNGTTSSSSLKLNGEPARKVKPRKRATDFLSDDENTEPKAPSTETEVGVEKLKPSKKKSKKEAEEDVPATAVKEQTSESKESSKPSVGVKSKKTETITENSDNTSSSDSDQDEDDQTSALIRGFESSGDEDDASGDEGFDPDKPVPKIPDSKKIKRKILKKQRKTGEPEERGTVYVGRIPHGFYEHQMRAYFSQFGEITRLRLSRNRVTGRSKHYAFVEFASSSVAKIVAETMDNYLMYSHILKCKFVPQEQLHPEVWKGSNRRFKKTPWNRIEKKRLENGKLREKWSKSIQQEQRRRVAKLEKLKQLGYEFEMPELKSVDEVPVQRKETGAPEAVQSVPNGIETGQPKAIEGSTEDVKIPADDTPKSSKKAKKTQLAAGIAELKQNAIDYKSKSGDITEAVVSPAGKKAKKADKVKNKTKV